MRARISGCRVRGSCRPTGDLPAAGIGDGQPQLGDGRGGVQPDLLAGRVTVAVLDGIGAGLAAATSTSCMSCG